MLKVWKKLWEPFGSCLLNSTANPAKLGWKWAGLAVLFSRQLPNGSHDFFQTFSIFFLNYFIRNPQTTIALAFLTHNISAIGVVFGVQLFIGVTKPFLVEIVNIFLSFTVSVSFMDASFGSMSHLCQLCALLMPRLELQLIIMMTWICLHFCFQIECY